jgi:glycosyltransferase involved in cell wall biosynthesis
MLRNRIYYSVKPFIPQQVRTALRRRVASFLRDSFAHTWPIMPGSEQPPENWPGWPDGKKFAVVLTHDIESKLGFGKCLKLMQLDLRFGFRSSFNFIPEGEYRVDGELREELAQNGFEVALHDLRHDGRLYRSRREFDRKAININRYLAEWGAVGFRSAFMLHKLEWLHQLNISYDASTFDTDPFEPQPEGRHTIFPFWVPRPNADHGSRIAGQDSRFMPSRKGYVELPYTLPQDFTLFSLLRERTPHVWLRKIDWIAENGGMVLVDTHPDYMSFSNQPGENGEYPVELYEQLLEHIRSKYAGQYWQPLPREVAAFVLQNQNEIRTPCLAPIGLMQQNGSRDVKAVGNGELNGARIPNSSRLRGKRAAVLLFSYYPADPRPRRAAEALAGEGVVIDLICLQQSQQEPRREIVNGVSVFRVPIERHRGGKVRYIRQYSAFILRSFFYITFRSIVRRYDFVHVHNMPDVLVFSALVPKALGAKVILDLHDPMPELMQTIFDLPEESLTIRLLKRLEKMSIACSDLVLTVNLACKKIYASRSCPPEKINVILNSPEDDLFEFKPPTLHSTNGKTPLRPFVILYHGSLVPRNGFDLAIDALETAKKSIPEAKLMVCGERTSFFDETMETAWKRGLGESVEYLGNKNRTQIVDAISRCDLGIIPNHRNIFTEINTPTRIFEYLALGKPVIAPRTQGIRDYFGDEDLVFFEPGDAGDLARKIEFAFSNPAELEQIVERGQRVYLAHQWSQEKCDLLDSISAIL